MKPLEPLLCLAAAIPSKAYYTMLTYVPSQPDIDGKIINAKDRTFVVGAKRPTTFCDLDTREQCPDGSSTLVNNKLTSLGVCSN